MQRRTTRVKRVTNRQTSGPPEDAKTKSTAPTATTKRKREALRENIGAKAPKSTAPVILDKENQQVKKPSAYVEVPNLVAAPRERIPTRTTNSGIATRSRIVVKRDEVPQPVSQHVSKKRRTSSAGPDEKAPPLQERRVVLEEHLEEVQAQAVVEEIKWDDLDKEDEADPLMVSEYVVEIFDYLRQLEMQTMPNPNYIDTQRDLAWKMRGILMDWLIQVHARFRLLPETLFLAVNVVDRFLSTRVVSLVRLQLVGITAMFIAAKYEEILAPSVTNFIYCSDSTYTEKDILDAEKYILRSIDYNLSYPNPINFLRRSSKADNYDLQVRTVAKYLVEVACVDWRMLPHPPSKIAAAGMWFARLILDKDEWTMNLKHYSGWDEAGLLPAAQLMLTYLLRAVKHESFYKKYAAKKYMKVSTYVREWLWVKFGQFAVEDYDADGEPTTGVEPYLHIVPSPASISLASELPRLREEIRQAREADALLQPVAEEEEA